jgi:hypothetical protein
MGLPRFRLRALMIAVAILALLAFGESMRRRRGRYRVLAEYHALSERSYAMFARMYRETLPFPTDEPGAALSPAARAKAERAEAGGAYHAAMRRKYEHAARSPWLPVEPDPPPPAPDAR